MADYTREEALAFLEAIRRTLDGKVGFKWYVERLGLLEAYVDSTAAESERLNAYIDQAGARDDFEAYCATAASDVGGDS